MATSLALVRPLSAIVSARVVSGEGCEGNLVAGPSAQSRRRHGGHRLFHPFCVL